MKNIYFLLMVAIVANFSACKDDEVPKNRCDHTGTIRSVTCGAGVWQNLWIQLDNGEWLQPWTSDIRAAVKQGDRVKFGYKIIKRDGRYDGQLICKALPPKAEAIHITCLEITGNETREECRIKGVLYDYSKLDGCGWVIEAENNERFEVNHFLDGSYVPVDRQRIVFNYIPVKPASICMTGKRVDISCIKPQEGGCKTEGILHYENSCKAWTVKSKKEAYEIQNPSRWFSEGMNVHFDYRVLQTYAVTCTKNTAIELTCIEGSGRD